MKTGKPTLQDKELSTELAISNFDESDHFAIDPLLKQELDEKNMAYRWINAKKWQDNYGYDARMWSPYKRDSKMTPGFEAFGIVDPNGYTRRGDLILAAQPQAVAARRREKIANKNKRLVGDHERAAAEQLRAGLRGKAKVTSGYDEND